MPAPERVPWPCAPGRPPYFRIHRKQPESALCPRVQPRGIPGTRLLVQRSSSVCRVPTRALRVSSTPRATTDPHPRPTRLPPHRPVRALISSSVSTARLVGIDLRDRRFSAELGHFVLS